MELVQYSKENNLPAAQFVSYFFFYETTCDAGKTYPTKCASGQIF